MKIYEFTRAPNPRRVRIFLAEKSIEVPYEQVDIPSAKHREPAFLAKNPMGLVPVLELDDGTFISESVAICRYFETLHPEPRLMGGPDAKDAATVEMWHRRMELELLEHIAGCFRNTNSFYKGRIPQVADWGEVCRQAAFERLDWLDSELANREFIAGDRYTIADITALAAVDFGRACDIRMKPEQKNLQRWHQAVSSRPSAKA